MRLKINSPVEKYFTPKGAIYIDGRCYIHKDDNRLICVFTHFTDILSKSQREWLHRVTDKLAMKEFGRQNYKITEHTEEHYHLIADEKDTVKKDRKKRASKPKGKPSTKETI